MLFKEEFSLSENIETFLNEDSKFDRNSKQYIVRLDIKKVIEEVLKDRTKHNNHSHYSLSNFPPPPNKFFKYLGLISDKAS